MTAEEILESVSAQAEVIDAPAEKPFNERTTADIGTAFNSLNQPLPQHNADQAGVPSAADLLKELESVGTKSPAAATGDEIAKDEPKDEDASEAGSRNLLKEMESLAGPPQTTSSQSTPAQAAPSQTTSSPATPAQPTPPKAAPAGKGADSIADKPSTDFSNYKFAAEDTNVGDPAYQYGIEEQAASAQTSKPAPKFEAAAKSGAPSTPPQGSSKSEPVKATSQDSGNNNHETETPEAKDLIKKMEEMTKAGASEWCAEYSFSDLDDLRREKAALTDSIKQAQTKISSIDNKISQLDGLKNALLSSDGEDLMNASAIVFRRLGWGCDNNVGASSELLLSTERPEAIVRVLRTNSQPKSSDIAQLAQSVITFWGEHEVEPKGVLVSCTWANRPPTERNEPDYTDALSEFAQKKNLALMTTMQLLCIYRDLEVGKANTEEIRKRILETNGKLLGYSLEHTMTKAAAG